MFIKNQTPTKVFSCEYCKIFKNSFFYKAPPVAASTGIRITEDDRWKPVAIEKKNRKILIIEPKNGGNERKMNEKSLLRQP